MVFPFQDHRPTHAQRGILLMASQNKHGGTKRSRDVGKKQGGLARAPSKRFKGGHKKNGSARANRQREWFLRRFVSEEARGKNSNA